MHMYIKIQSGGKVSGHLAYRQAVRSTAGPSGRNTAVNGVVSEAAAEGGAEAAPRRRR